MGSGARRLLGSELAAVRMRPRLRPAPNCARSALVKWFCPRLNGTVLPDSAVHSVRRWTENKRICLLFAAFFPALAKELGKTPSASISPGVKRDPDGFCTQFCAAHAAPQRQPLLSDAKGPSRWQKSSGGTGVPDRAVPAFPAAEGQGRDGTGREVSAAPMLAAAAPCGPFPAQLPQGPHLTRTRSRRRPGGRSGSSEACSVACGQAVTRLLLWDPPPL